jgi:hypothetical protein
MTRNVELLTRQLTNDPKAIAKLLYQLQNMEVAGGSVDLSGRGMFINVGTPPAPPTQRHYRQQPCRWGP